MPTNLNSSANIPAGSPLSRYSNASFLRPALRPRAALCRRAGPRGRAVAGDNCPRARTRCPRRPRRSRLCACVHECKWVFVRGTVYVCVSACVRRVCVARTRVPVCARCDFSAMLRRVHLRMTRGPRCAVLGDTGVALDSDAQPLMISRNHAKFSVTDGRWKVCKCVCVQARACV